MRPNATRSPNLKRASHTCNSLSFRVPTLALPHHADVQPLTGHAYPWPTGWPWSFPFVANHACRLFSHTSLGLVGTLNSLVLLLRKKRNKTLTPPSIDTQPLPCPARGCGCPHAARTNPCSLTPHASVLKKSHCSPRRRRRRPLPRRKCPPTHAPAATAPRRPRRSQGRLPNTRAARHRWHRRQGQRSRPLALLVELP
jgi:hypothetical protein